MIGFFSISTQLGGAEKSLLDFLREYRKIQPNLCFIPTHDSGPLVDEIKACSIEIKVFNLPTWLMNLSRKHPLQLLVTAPLLLVYFFPLIWKTQKFIKENKLRVIHTTGMKFHLIIGMSLLLTTDVHQILHLRDFVKHPLLKFIFKLLRMNSKVHFVVNSKSTHKSLGFEEAEIIYNGFQLDHKSETPTQELENIYLKWDLPKNKKIVAVIGALARWKGQREFIKAASLLVAKRQDLFFLVVGSEIYDTSGDKGELASLKNLAKDLGLENHLRFIPFQKNLSPIFTVCDVLCHSSIEPEPFGRIIIEAMIHGVVVTASAEGGPLEIIEPKKNGLLHSPKSLSERVDNIEFLIDHPSLKKEMELQALKDIEKFRLSTHIQKMSDLFSRYL